jgi:CO dehydrogenase nickel-insertion accessory protein CooC1
MLSAAEWFVENKLAQVKELLHQRPGYELLLVGHSLGAGETCCCCCSTS